MKSFFSFSLTGKDWWKPFIAYWILYLVMNGVQQRITQKSIFIIDHPGSYTLVSILITLGMVILSSIFMILFLRIILPKLSINGKEFAFRGNIGTYLKITLVGTFLTIITLTIYLPWYLRRVTSYMVSETTFSDGSPEFLGKPGKYLKWFLLSFWLPMIAVIAVTAAIAGTSYLNGVFDPDYIPQTAVSIWMFLTVLAMLIVLVPFYYLMYKWLVNFRWNDVSVEWQTSFWPSCGFILEQLLLSIITLGIYWPAALLRIFGYFAERTVFTREGLIMGRLGFSGEIGKGFGLIWGQTLLSAITLGIYIPWATAKIGRWVASTTYYEELSPM